MAQFPFPQTEQLLKRYKHIPPKTEEYQDLLKVFIREYLNTKSIEFYPFDLEKAMIDYLSQEEKETHLTWYYCLEHQYTYYISHETFDSADLNYITLQDVILYPIEYEGIREMVQTESQTEAATINR